VNQGWQSEPTDGSKGGWSVGLSICLSVCLSIYLSFYPHSLNMVKLVISNRNNCLRDPTLRCLLERASIQHPLPPLHPQASPGQKYPAQQILNAHVKHDTIMHAHLRFSRRSQNRLSSTHNPYHVILYDSISYI